MPSVTGQGGKRKPTESAMEFQKASAWHSQNGSFRETLKGKVLLPRFRLLWLIQ